ncbi:MAG TPA: Hsp33 family molecular chaperone [Geminicoccaceae bacterium]|nr:Hsp33 family molecular chaperone [Geminicoccaceae bacterium]
MNAELLSDNLMQPFQLESSALRGRVIRLGDTVDRVLTRHDYPEPVSRLLGELLVLTATLAGALKYAGVFSLQTRSDGPVSFMVADCTADGALRGYARFDAGRIAALPGATAADLLGRGYLALTVDQGRYSEAYQGIVELTGKGLTDSMLGYFRRSEQLQTGLRVAVDRVGEAGGDRARWRAGGLMVQRLPEEGRAANGDGARDGREPQEDWRRTMILLGTATDDELVDPDLPARTLLYRLFHEEGVRVFRPMTLGFGCRCNRERVEALLRSFGEDELEEMKRPDGRIDVTCEFCNEDFVFDDADLRSLRGGAGNH